MQLNQEQVFFLKVFTGYKAFARKENFVTDQRYSSVKISKSYDELAQECLKLGLLKADKNGRLSLKLTWDKTRQLMAIQTDTVQSLTEELTAVGLQRAENQATIDRLSPVNPPWPSTDHYNLKDAREQLVYLNEKTIDLLERLKMVQK